MAALVRLCVNTLDEEKRILMNILETDRLIRSLLLANYIASWNDFAPQQNHNLAPQNDSTPQQSHNITENVLSPHAPMCLGSFSP